MLSPEEREQVESVTRQGPEPRYACIEALRIVQNHRRWLDDEAVRDVASALRMSVAEVESVATFYNLLFRREVGRHVVFVCESVSCWLAGCARTFDAIQKATGAGRGDTDADRRFTVLPIQCLGACDRAPVVVVDEDLHTHVTGPAVAAMLEGYE